MTKKLQALQKAIDDAAEFAPGDIVMMKGNHKSGRGIVVLHKTGNHLNTRRYVVTEVLAQRCYAGCQINYQCRDVLDPQVVMTFNAIVLQPAPDYSDPRVQEEEDRMHRLTLDEAETSAIRQWIHTEVAKEKGWRIALEEHRQRTREKRANKDEKSEGE